jgi:hypothetical protein
MTVRTKVWALALLCTFGAAGASAQRNLQSPGLELKAPSLEPTLKVYPTPKVETQNPTPAVPVACICTEQYDPVCARARDGTRRTYSNACRARCENAALIGRGPC